MTDLTRPGSILSARLRAPLRRVLRESLPVDVRIAARRAPAVARHYLSPPARLAVAPMPWAHVQCERATPLRRRGTTYAPALQAAKETNVSRAAELLHGTVVASGETFSWHRQVGPPLRVRGFAPGPELHEGELARGTGGGACQVANLVFWLALHAGLDVVERHRHGQDLFPDSARTVPFGCGATVFHPTRDLKLRNPNPWPVRLSLTTNARWLRGAIQLRQPPPHHWTIVELDHRFQLEDGVVWRTNRLARERTDRPGVRQLLVTNRARVAYPVPPEALSPPDREDP